MPEAIQILEEAFKDIKVKDDLVAIKELFLAQCYLSENKIGKFKECFARLSRYESFLREVPDVHCKLCSFQNFMIFSVKRSKRSKKNRRKIPKFWSSSEKSTTCPQ